MSNYTRVLVTGGAGFIGSHLCDALVEKNYHVLCLDNLATGHKANIEPLLAKANFEFIQGDICDRDLCMQLTKNTDFVLHQAALGSVPRSIDDPQNTNHINIDGFLNVLRAAQQNGVKRFIFAASSSTYGDDANLPKTEDRIGNPLSPYAVTKLVNELYAQVFYKIYGLDYIGLRYFNVFGPRQDPNGAYAAAIPKFISAILNNQEVSIHGDGEQSRDFTYIKNVVQANLLAIETQNPAAINQIYNVAYGANNTVNKLIDSIKLCLTHKGVDLPKVKLNYIEARIGDVKHSLASIEKAKKLLHYYPQYDLVKGLQESMPWYLQSMV